MDKKFFLFAIFGILLFHFIVQAFGHNDPNCKLSTTEQLLDKMIRTETKVETLVEEIRKIEEYVMSVLEYRKQQSQKILSELKENNDAVKENLKGIGSSYIRWGRTSCPTDNELIYKGFAAGSNYLSIGGASNFLCLTEEPQWGYYEDSVASAAKVLGAEYEFSDHHADGGSKYFKKNLNDHDAPCSLCRTPRSDVIMIPGRLECYTGWTKEYSGYLVAGAERHKSATEYICLDTDAEKLQSGSSNKDGRVIYMVESICGTLRCPPYVQGRELTCVVCSR